MHDSNFLITTYPSCNVDPFSKAHTPAPHRWSISNLPDATDTMKVLKTVLALQQSVITTRRVGKCAALKYAGFVFCGRTGMA